MNPGSTTLSIQRRRGFTLLEMALTLLLVSLLVGAVFGILQSSLQLADAIKGEADRELRLQRFIELLENTLNRLPPDAVISIRPSQGLSGGSQIIEIANARSPFDAATPGVLTLGTAQAKDGTTTVVMKFEEIPLNFSPSKRLDTARPIELALLGEISGMLWRVYDPTTQKWIDKWNEKVIAADLIKSGALNQTSPAPMQGAGAAAQGQNIQLTTPEATAAAGQAGGQTTNPVPNLTSSLYPRPPMLELQIQEGSVEPRPWIFWVPPSVVPAGGAQ